MLYEHKTIKSRDDLRVEVLYVNDETDEALWTPDGIGCFFYDVEEEGMEAHGVTAEDCRLLTPEEWEAVTRHY